MSDSWKAELDASIDRHRDQIIGLRRHLHSHPEISGHEHRTSLHLYQLLGDAGFDVRMGPDGRGVVADMVAPQSAARGNCIALRADIDALSIQDEKTVPYRSQCDGVMHACGHDAHTAIVSGALLALNDMRARNKLPWEMRFRGILQPSEETATGAAEMVECGSLDGVGAILATHVDPTREVGRIGVRSGVLTAQSDAMHICITGRGGHAARPHESIDPIAAAAQLINAIYLHVPRAVDSQDAVVVTIGQIAAGENPNVIPEQVVLTGILRTLRTGVRERTMRHLEQICHGTAESSGTRIDIEFSRGLISVYNDDVLTNLIRRSAEDVLAAGDVEEIPRPSMGSEDFAVYLQHVPGTMFRLGCASPNGEASSPLHTPTFDVDEKALFLGARILARAALHWGDPSMREPPSPQI